MAEQQPAFKKSFGLLDATMIVAGSMIGSGIFIVSADITRNVGSAGLADSSMADNRVYDHFSCGKLW
jgi:hypothetical protein